MRLYEHEAKSIFRSLSISTPQSVLVGSLSELRKVTFPVVLKAQVLLGRRGKAGLIQGADSLDEALSILQDMIGKRFDGHEVKAVLVEEKVDVEKEYYCAATIDRIRHRPLLITSDQGGMEIEEISRVHPETVHKRHFEPGEKIEPYVGREMASRIELKGERLVEMGAVLTKIYTMLVEYDCKLVEINPLVITRSGRILALDAKVDLDEDAMYRHSELR